MTTIPTLSWLTKRFFFSWARSERHWVLQNSNRWFKDLLFENTLLTVHINKNSKCFSVCKTYEIKGLSPLLNLQLSLLMRKGVIFTTGPYLIQLMTWLKDRLFYLRSDICLVYFLKSLNWHIFKPDLELELLSAFWGFFLSAEKGLLFQATGGTFWKLICVFNAVVFLRAISHLCLSFICQQCCLILLAVTTYVIVNVMT